MGLVSVTLQVCEMCLSPRTDGRDEECHTPGCVYWMDDAPEGRTLAVLRIAARANGSPRAVGRMGLSGNLHVDNRPSDAAIAEQSAQTEAYYADPDV